MRSDDSARNSYAEEPFHEGTAAPKNTRDDGCWGGWTRTNACQSQSLVPYQLGYAPSAIIALDQRTTIRVRAGRSSTGTPLW
jgi:hypothetical protein